MDIIYELRDATDFVPSLKKPWWEELPEAHEGAWAARAARRKGRDDFRLAFIVSKYRLGPEPEPFCLELNLPAGSPWTLDDVTDKLRQAGEAAQAESAAAHTAQLDAAARALYEVVIEQHTEDNPILKTEAETFLYKEQDITQREARQVIKEHIGKLWDIVPGPRGRGKGPAQILIPLTTARHTPQDDDRINNVREAASDMGEEGTYSVSQEQSGRQNNQPSSPCAATAAEIGLFCHDSRVLDNVGLTEQPAPDDGGDTPQDGGRINDVLEDAPDEAEKGTYSAGQSQSGRQNNQPSSPCETSPPEDGLFCQDRAGIEESASAEYAHDRAATAIYTVWPEDKLARMIAPRIAEGMNFREIAVQLARGGIGMTDTTSWSGAQLKQFWETHGTLSG